MKREKRDKVRGVGVRERVRFGERERERRGKRIEKDIEKIVEDYFSFKNRITLHDEILVVQSLKKIYNKKFPRPIFGALPKF